MESSSRGTKRKRKRERGEGFRRKAIESSSRGTKDKIVLRAQTGGSYQEGFMETSYHVLDLIRDRGGDEVPPSLLSAPPLLEGSHSYGPVVVVGSRIYLFGERHLPSAMIPPCCFLVLNMSEPSKGWIEAPSPLDNMQDCLPANVVVYDGKIYLFRSYNFSFICQVFDPNVNRWSRIQSPPRSSSEEDKLKLATPALADLNNNRILLYAYAVGSISALYAYYPCQDRWERLIQDFEGWYRWSHPPVTLADGVIYYHNGIHVRNGTVKGFVSAYHIADKQWLKVRLSPDVVLDPEYHHEYHCLLYRGNGLLCLLASGDDYDMDANELRGTCVYLVEFKVDVINVNDTTKEVLVTSCSSKLYHIRPRGHVLNYYPFLLP